MSKKEKSSSSKELVTLVTAIIGVIGTITVAYFAYRGNVEPKELEIASTQTAESIRVTQTAHAQISSTQNPVEMTTTVPPDTPTATATLTPTLVPTQTPIILFSDSFDTNINGWALGNRDGNITKQNRQIAESTLQLDFFFYKEGATGWVNVPNFNIKDFYMSVDVEVIQFSTRSELGIVFPFRMTNNGNTSYTIEFNNDGTFSLYSTQTLTQDGRWTLLHRENSELIQLTEGVINKFAIRVLGQRFTAYVNDIELFTFEDNSIRSSGEVGVGLTGNSQKAAIVRFDNLVITE